MELTRVTPIKFPKPVKVLGNLIDLNEIDDVRGNGSGKSLVEKTSNFQTISTLHEWEFVFKTIKYQVCQIQ